MNYLVHYGIAGQKWGKRNGPPYPLSYGDHSAAEKKNINAIDKKRTDTETLKKSMKSYADSSSDMQNAISSMQNSYAEYGKAEKAVYDTFDSMFKDNEFLDLCTDEYINRTKDETTPEEIVDDLLMNHPEPTGSKILNNYDKAIENERIAFDKYYSDRKNAAYKLADQYSGIKVKDIDVKTVNTAKDLVSRFENRSGTLVNASYRVIDNYKPILAYDPEDNSNYYDWDDVTNIIGDEIRKRIKGTEFE